MTKLVLFQEDKIGLTVVESVNGIDICVSKGKKSSFSNDSKKHLIKFNTHPFVFLKQSKNRRKFS